MSVLVNGKMLKTIRGKRRLSQQSLADLSGVSIATIKRIESSQIATSRNTVSVKKITTALGIDIQDLSEDNFDKIVDIGSDIEMHIGDYTDIQEVRDGMDHIISLIERRNRILRGK